MLKSKVGIVFEEKQILTPSNIAASKKRAATNKRVRVEPKSDMELLTDFFVQGSYHYEIIPDISEGHLTFAADMIVLPHRTKIIPSGINPGERAHMMNDEDYVVRLVPISGRVKQVKVNGSGTVTKSFCRVWEISSAKAWYLYIFFEVPPNPLGPIEIPEDFRKYRELKLPRGS